MNIIKAYKALLVALFLPVLAEAQFAGGDGSSGNPFRISNCTQLQAMQSDLDAAYTLTGDIDCSATSGWNSGAGFEPVGTFLSRFTGTLNGQGFTISGLRINRPSLDGVGLIGYGRDATLTNLRLVDEQITGISFVGLLAGFLKNSTVSRVSVAGSVSCASNLSLGRIGGFVGQIEAPATISECQSNATISAPGADDAVGGFVGLALSDGGALVFSDCAAHGTITGPDTRSGGFLGLIEYSSGGTVTVRRSYSSTSITIASATAAGLYGSSTAIGGGGGGSILSQNSFAAGSASSPGSDGGVLGFDGVLPTFDGTYWDITRTGQSNCVADGTTATGCIGVNASSSEANYFLGNSTNPPLNSWNFTSIWQVQTGDYPQLRAFIPTPTPTATPSPTPTFTSTSTPTATPTATATSTITPTPTHTATASPTTTSTPTLAPTSTPVSTPTNVATPTATNTPESSPTAAPTQSPAPTVDPAPTAVPTPPQPSIRRKSEGRLVFRIPVSGEGSGIIRQVLQIRGRTVRSFRKNVRFGANGQVSVRELRAGLYTATVVFFRGDGSSVASIPVRFRAR